MSNSLKPLFDRIHQVSTPLVTGHITRVEETVLHGVLPGARIGTIVQFPEFTTPTFAQVTAVDGTSVTLMRLSDVNTISVSAPMRLAQKEATVPVSAQLLGRVINPMGEAMDDRGPIPESIPWPLHRSAPHPLQRPSVTLPLVTGTKSIDGLLTLGRGARFGLFAGPGQGKSTLLGNLAGQAQCDVVVICLAGERGREAGEFVHRILGPEGIKRSVVVLSTSDTPAAQRVLSVQTATAIAEWFRDQGNHVLLLVDSLTRIVRAKRDMDLANGAPIGPNGLSATTLSFLPPLLERAAPNNSGSISAVYTVLEQTSGDELISSEITSLLDGHILLSKKRADAGKWPAINVVESVSRVMAQVVPDDARKHASKLRQVLAAWDENEELVLIGAYNRGSCKHTDTYLAHKDAIDAFLMQDTVPVHLEDTQERLHRLVSRF